MSYFLHLSREDIDQIIGIALDELNRDFGRNANQIKLDVERKEYGQAISYIFSVNNIRLGTYTLPLIGQMSQKSISYDGDSYNDELALVFQYINKFVLRKLSEKGEEIAFFKGFTSTKWGTHIPSRTPLPDSTSLTLKVNLQDFEQELTHFVETFEFDNEKKGRAKKWKEPGPYCPDPLSGQGWDILIQENEYASIKCALIWVTPIPNHLLLTIPPRYSPAGDSFVSAFVNFCRKRWDGEQKEVEPEPIPELVDKLVSEYEDELLVSFDILDASVSRRVEGYTAKLANSVRHEIVSGARVIYILKWPELGCFGGVELRKSAPETSWLSFLSYQESNQHLRQLKKEHREQMFDALKEGLAEDGIYDLHAKNRQAKFATGQPFTLPGQNNQPHSGKILESREKTNDLVQSVPVEAKIRKLLVVAFDDEEFVGFCSDNFSSVYNNFGRGMTKGEKIQLLLDHCSRHGELPRLLQLLQDSNPYQYSRFIESQQ